MKKFWPLLLFLTALILSALGARAPQAVEELYSQGAYPVIARVLALFTGWLPFSVAEVKGILIAAAVATAILTSIFDRDWRNVRKIVVRLVSATLIVYFLFIVMWGLNYNRLPFAQVAGLDTSNPTQEELVNVCAELIAEANALRSQLMEDTNGVFYLPQGIADALKRTQLGYNHASVYYPTLARHYSRPKGVMASKLMSYQGIGGIYIPFTGEANVNTLMPHSIIPFAAAHEAAHQHGYAREDEANFIAYLTCSLHPDRDFKYSGTLHALHNAMRALEAVNKEEHSLLSSTISAAVKRDTQAERDFWASHEGILERISNRMNDFYLKANRQQDGVASYGRMVDLLIAYQRKGHEGR